MKPVVLLGSPGSGKGTQGKLLAAHFGIPHISTGEMLRDHVQNGTALGLSVKDTVGKGLLVPDSLMEDMVASRLRREDCDDGYILDGYPRTVPQAEWLYDHLQWRHPAVFLLDVPEAVVLARIAARSDGRADDASATVFGRMEEYRKLTAPVVKYYELCLALHRVDGTTGADNVFQQIKSLMEGK